MQLNAAANYLRSKSLLSYLLAMVVLVMAMQMFALPNRSNVKVKHDIKQRTVKFLPDMGIIDMKGKGPYRYSFSLYYNSVETEQTAFIITSGACLKRIFINGKEIPFRKYGHCLAYQGAYWNPYEYPVFVEMGPHLHKGRNNIEVRSQKAEFNIGPVIMYNPAKPAMWIGMTMILVTCLALVVFMERMTGDWIAGFIVAAAFSVYMHRFHHQHANMYSMDLPGHILYYSFIAQKWAIPKPFWGWSYYHAPLYYTLQACMVWLADMLRSFDVLNCTRVFSLACFMGFVIYFALMLHKLIRVPAAYYVALTLLVFYPAGIIFSSRLDSNLLFYACYAACIYHTLCWLDYNRKRDLGLALMMFGYAIASRTNALILIPILVLAFAYHALLWERAKGLMNYKFVRLGVIVAILGLTVSVGRTEFYRLTESRNDPFLVGNAGWLSRTLLLEPWSFYKLFIPNLSMYFSYPYWSVFSDATGRQYFMNSMLKSSMFGEFIWGGFWIAVLMNKLLIALIAYIFEGYLLHRKTLRRNRNWWICLVTLGVPIAALMANRIAHPFGCSEDFRYIYPAIASFCGLFGLVTEQHIKQWRPFRVALGVFLCASFALCSAVFYML